MQKVTIRFPQEKKTACSKTMLIQPDGQSVNRRKLHLFPLGNSSMHNVSSATACSSTIRILRFEITVGSGCGNMLPLLLLLHVLRPRLVSEAAVPPPRHPRNVFYFLVIIVVVVVQSQQTANYGIIFVDAKCLRSEDVGVCRGLVGRGSRC